MELFVELDGYVIYENGVIMVMLIVGQFRDVFFL